VIARRIVDRAAARLPGREARARYREEWRADLDRVSGRPARLGFALTVLLFSAPRIRRQAARAEREVPGLTAACDRAIGVFEDVDGLGALQQAIAEGVVSGLGFAAATLNLVRRGGDLQCVAAVGPPEMREVLLGSTSERAQINGLLARGEPWGTLRFVHHLHDCGAGRGFSVETAQEGGRAGRRGAWRRTYWLLAPMYTPTGQLLGVVSLDEPTSGRLPGPAQRALVETYARRAADSIFRMQNRPVGAPDD
jgi:hypothetical protein